MTVVLRVSKLVLKQTLIFSLLIASVVHPAYGASESLQELLKEQSRTVLVINKKAKKNLLRTLENSAFEQYFSATDDSSRKIYKEQIEEAILHTQKLYDVEEICLIDRAGNEIARVDHGHINDDLATDEEDALFFEPGFKVSQGHSLISPIYFSPDSHGWVIAYVTPVYSDGDAVALLHYEHDLAYLQKKVIDGVPEDKFVVAVSEDGWIVANSRHPVAFSQQAGRDAATPDAYFSKELYSGVTAQSVIETVQAGKQPQGYQALTTKVGRWTLLAMQSI